MKSFDQLNKVEQTNAIQYAREQLLTHIVEGIYRFNDELNGDKLQKRIDRALAKAERLQTPWFAAAILLEDKQIKEAVEGMALCQAEDCLYSEPSDQIVIDGIAGSLVAKRGAK